MKEYIASAEKASKIAKLLDAATDEKINDSPIGDATISDVLSNSSIMEKIDTAKEFVADIDSDVEKQIRENNDKVNKYDWNTLFDYEEVDGQITIKSYIGFDDLDVIVIPDRINGLLVTKIGEKAFENCKTVKKVVLPVGLPDACEDIYGLDSYDNIFGRFVDNGRITIYCNAGSSAMKYARKFSIPVKRYEEFDLLEE